jgi:ketopantoate reductase
MIRIVLVIMLAVKTAGNRLLAQQTSRSRPCFISSHQRRHQSHRLFEAQTQSIAIVGAGAIGAYYGGRIVASVRDVNTDVFFHLRGEHYRHCKQHGINISSHHGDFSISAEELLCFETTEEMRNALEQRGSSDEGFDWVVCALKSTSLDAVPDLIDPLLSPKTRLLVIMNGLIEDEIIRLLAGRNKLPKAIYGVYLNAVLLWLFVSSNTFHLLCSCTMHIKGGWH